MNNTRKSFYPSQIKIGTRTTTLQAPRDARGGMLSVLEILFFGYLFYTHLSIVFDIYIPSLAGAWILILAGVSLFYTLLEHDNQRKTALILVGVSTLVFVLVQLYFAVPFSALKAHLTWVAYIVIIYPHIQRPNFIKRLVIVLSTIILLLYPFIEYSYSGDIPRVAFSGTGIDNANVVGAWIGFCALFFWLWGGVEKSWRSRSFLWTLAILLFFYMLQTISRGSLVGFLAGVVMSFRQVKFKETVVRFFTLLFIFYIALNTSLVANTIDRYKTRMFVETGRFEIWPLAFELIKKQPWLGYGANHIEIFVLSRYLLPHNVILYMLLAGGIISTIPFVILWLNALVASFKSTAIMKIQDIDPLPLVVFVLIQYMSYDVAYISIFSALTICYSLSLKSLKNIPS